MKKNIWLPYYYTAKIKRDPQFFVKQVLLEELPIVVLVFGLFGLGLQVASWIALAILFMALIAVYEIGYADNDRIGERKETNPKLSDAYRSLGAFRIVPFAWFWAILLTGIGVAVLPLNVQEATVSRLSLPVTPGTIQSYLALTAIWLFVILLSQLTFAIFNRAPLKWRVFAYVPLHVSKYLGFAIFFASSLVGLVFLVAHIVRTWSLYAVRRAGGDMEFIASQMVRLVFLILFLTVLGIAYGWIEIFWSWQTLTILGFCIIRALPELRKKMM
ncbi:MAG: hypothetical protein AAFW60_08010 [Pseudomonadota bacterium]